MSTRSKPEFCTESQTTPVYGMCLRYATSWSVRNFRETIQPASTSHIPTRNTIIKCILLDMAKVGWSNLSNEQHDKIQNAEPLLRDNL